MKNKFAPKWIGMNKGILICFLALFTGFSYGQINPVKIDEFVEQKDVSWEASIAINPEDPDNIVAASSDGRIYITLNGGTTFSQTAIYNSDGNIGSPVIKGDRKGRFYYFHGLSSKSGTAGFEKIVCYRSKDRGNSWEEIGYPGEGLPNEKELVRVEIDDKDRLYATWTYYDKHGNNSSGHESNILFAESNNGKKWGKPIRINKLPGNGTDDHNTTMGAMPAVGHERKIYVVWAYNEKIYLDRSFDKGRLWIRSDIEILEQPGGWKFDIPGFKELNGYPVISVYNLENSPLQGRIYISWSYQRQGPDDTDVWMAWSDNFGDHFIPPRRIGHNGEGSHQFMPWMTIDQMTGHIYIIYYEMRMNDLGTYVYLAYSENAGKNFKHIKLSREAFIPEGDRIAGRYINMDVYNGRIAMIWFERSEGKTSLWTAVTDHETLASTEN